MDVANGHEILLGRQLAPITEVHHQCKLVQVPLTDHEEAGMCKPYAGPSVKGEKIMTLGSNCAKKQIKLWLLAPN